MTYSEYVVQEFQEHFGELKDQKIAIYGSGELTERVLEVCENSNIVCLFDSMVNGNSLKYGKRLYHYKEIEYVKPEMIVVIARKKSTAEIYEQIQGICKNNKISLYDYQGNDLFHYYSGEEKKRRWLEYCHTTKEDLINQISEHEIISFDVFDTLIMRQVPKPDDIFEMIESELKNSRINIRNFTEVRKQAEKKNSFFNPNIYEIYQYEAFERTGYSEQLLKLELDMERKMLVRRECMAEMLRYANQLGKKVYLLSDMYLPHDILQRELKRLDITEYDKLYVSCDYREKKSGRLYQIFKSKIRGESYLHIGDHEDVDGICARANGMDTFQIKRAYELYVKNGDKKFFNSKMELGMYIAKEYNNPFIFAEKERNES